MLLSTYYAPPMCPVLLWDGLQGVKDSAALRAAVEEIQPENVKLGLRLSQSRYE